MNTGSKPFTHSAKSEHDLRVAILSRGTAMSTVISDIPLFTSAEAAVKFAVNITGRPLRPAMNRVADKGGTGNGMTDIDAAGQAGIIMAKVRALGVTMAAAITARSARRMLKCECKRPCCSGELTNSVWLSAVDVLAKESYAKPCGCHASYYIRSTLVKKIYGQQQVLAELAEETEYDRNTISAHYGRIHRWLLGQKATGVYAEKEGVENQAWAKLDANLKNSGIVSA